MRSETKVGLLFGATLLVIIVFAAALGVFHIGWGQSDLNVMYNYAGGIEEGSPIRVMGIKVGKVKKISFEPHYVSPQGEEVKLKIVISINNDAWASLRTDSKFFINLAGVIGEKFLEITPGQSSAPELKAGDFVRGEDPPRIDQLISQSYGLAGKLISILEKNEGSVTKTIEQLDILVTNFNKTLVLLDKTSKNRNVGRLLENSIKISDDVAYFTGQLRSPKAEQTYDLVHRLLFRLEPVDGPLIKKFFQEQGIRARIF